MLSLAALLLPGCGKGETKESPEPLRRTCSTPHGPALRAPCIWSFLSNLLFRHR